jgi:hypothetical protein
MLPVSRMAGKALMDFFKVLSGEVGGAVRNKTLSALAGMQNPTGLFATMAAHPETTANLVGAAAPLLATGGITAAGYLGKKALDSVTGGQNDSGQRVSFANQQYVPGTSPMTNQTMARALLAEQRMQQQLQVLQARENALVGHGTLQRSSGLADIMELASKIYV